MNKVKFNNTIRDFAQSNLSAAPSATEIVTAESHATDVGWASLQVGGGTFFDVPVMRGRDPWAEQKILCDAYQGVPKTILVRGDSAVGYNIYREDVVNAMVRQYAKTGVNGFTIFDGLNDTRNQEAAIKAVNECKAEGMDVYAQGVICIGSSKAFTVDGALRNAEALNEMGVRDIYLKDPVGVSDPEFVHRLVTALKREFDNPVYVHTHNTHGKAYAIYMAGIEAGADAIDVAHPAGAENVGQPSALRMLHLMSRHPSQSVRDRAPALNIDAIAADSDAIAAMRYKYKSLEPAFDREVFAAMLAAKAPGGAASTLKGMMEGQFKARGLSWRDAQIAIYNKQAQILDALGDPLQVTPHAKNTTSYAATRLLLGDTAQTPEIGLYLTGQYGKVQGEPAPGLVEQALKKAGMTGVYTGKPADLVKEGLPEARQKMVAAGIAEPKEEDVITVALLNKGDQGLKHVLNKHNGTLAEVAPPEQPKHTVDFTGGGERYVKNGVEIKTPNDVYEAIGGAAGVMNIALLAMEKERKGHYKEPSITDQQAAELNRAGPRYFKDEFRIWRQDADKGVKAIIDEIPMKLHEAGFKEGAQLTKGIEIANAIIHEACVQKGISERNIPKADIVAAPRRARTASVEAGHAHADEDQPHLRLDT